MKLHRGTRWTLDDIPDLAGRTAVVTGANSGLGYETALALAGRGAHVVLACRRPAAADEAIEAIRIAAPAASVEFVALDLASLESVRTCAADLLAHHAKIDLLCNNAGVMALPPRRTADGFEMQFGTNHLGHFALTGLLLDRLTSTEGSRVVTLSSTAHKIGRMRFDDLQWERGYMKWPAYGQSKLANLLFTYELQRRLERASSTTVALAAHPGYAATNLQLAGPKMEASSFGVGLMTWANGVFAQDAAMGALPTLRAATDPEASGGQYYGPDGPFEAWGYPIPVASSARSHDRKAAKRLWDDSVRLTGVGYEALEA